MSDIFPVRTQAKGPALEVETATQQSRALCSMMQRRVKRPEDAEAARACIKYVQQADEEDMAIAEQIINDLLRFELKLKARW